jgi:hypothetical protein
MSSLNHNISIRLESLDILRGLTIAGMILVNNPGNWQNTWPILNHAQWDGLTDFVKRPQIGAKGLVYMRYNADGTYKSSVDKFYNSEELEKWATETNMKQGDLLLVLCGDLDKTRKQLNELRLHLGNQLGLRKIDEFKPLWVANDVSPEFRNAFAYLKRRGVSIFDIIKYRIGYCETGLYSGKIIIPSFAADGSLNYFVGRGYYPDDQHKHKNPDVSKNIIGFELFVNWQLPVILVEGAFDAIAIKRNSIPLFGKTINDALKTKIIDNNVTDIYICLDKDARKQALETANYFIAKGIRVYFVDLEQKDPSEIGFRHIQEIIKKTEQMNESDLFAQTLLSSLKSKVSGSEIII